MSRAPTTTTALPCAHGRVRRACRTLSQKVKPRCCKCSRRRASTAGRAAQRLNDGPCRLAAATFCCVHGTALLCNTANATTSLDPSLSAPPSRDTTTAICAAVLTQVHLPRLCASVPLCDPLALRLSAPLPLSPGQHRCPPLASYVVCGTLPVQRWTNGSQADFVRFAAFYA